MQGQAVGVVYQEQGTGRELRQQGAESATGIGQATDAQFEEQGGNESQRRVDDVGPIQEDRAGPLALGAGAGVVFQEPGFSCTGAPQNEDDTAADAQLI
jgi:hypothetical protein